MLSTSNKTWLFSFAIFLLFAGSLTTALLVKENLLWMDEILSYLLISDPSLAHLNEAMVSGFDQTPPLFANLYWLIAHAISLNVVFLKIVSVVFFAATLTLFYHYTTRIVGTPAVNFVLISGMAAFTFLNITLAIQIRSYVLLLLIGFIYFIIIHQLARRPASVRLLVVHTVVGLSLALTHNFGLFYLAASGAFFGILWLWSKDRRYWYVLGTFGLMGATWLLAWYPKFAIQAKAGEPHSWISLPTFLSFFRIVGELAPTVSNNLEGTGAFVVLAMLRFVGIVALFSYIAIPVLKNGFRAAVADSAFRLYLMAGFIYSITILIAVVFSFVHTSVFISRYLWPNHLLVIYQLLYAFYYLTGPRFSTQSFRSFGAVVPLINGFVRRGRGWLLPCYVLCLAGFLFYQNWKTNLAPVAVMAYMDGLDKKYPVFVESSINFLPIWYYKKDWTVNFLLDYEPAFDPRNDLGASVGYHTLKGIKDKYNVGAVVPLDHFNVNRVPHFYVLDERWNYQIERFIQNGTVRVVGTIPTTLDGITILECVFTGAAADTTKALPANNLPSAAAG